jgi:hypothetical protein
VACTSISPRLALNDAIDAVPLAAGAGAGAGSCSKSTTWSRSKSSASRRTPQSSGGVRSQRPVTQARGSARGLA